MNTPVQSAHDHLQAFFSQDIEEINRTTLFPFFHVNPDGEASIFNSAEDLAPLGDQPFRSEIIECTVLDSGEDSAVLGVVFQRFDLDGVKTIKAKAVWGAARIENRWAVRWRQFLGGAEGAA
jgi:hypothetical protein